MATTVEQRSVSVRIDGKEVENSLKSISAEIRALRNDTLKLSEGTAEYNQKALSLAQANEAFKKNQESVKAIADAWKLMPESVRVSVTTMQTSLSSLQSKFKELGSIKTPEMTGLETNIAAITTQVKETRAQFRETELSVKDNITGISAKLKDLKDRYQELSDAGKDLKSPEMKALKAEIKAVNDELKDSKTQYSTLKTEQQATLKAMQDNVLVLKNRYDELVKAQKDASTPEMEGLKKEILTVQREIQKTTNEYIELGKQIDEQKKGLKSMSDAWSKNITPIKAVAASMAGLFAVDKIITFGKELADISIKTDALSRKSLTVLGDELGHVSEQAQRNAAAMGLTTAQYVAATAGIADLLIPMGFQRKQAADISLQLQDLSGALAEWSSGTHTAAEASSTMSKALLGEREELKSYGIAISEEDVKQRLLTKGMQDLTGQRLAQAKAIATLELVLEKSKDAQTSYATNTDSLIRQQALFKARIEEISEKLAKIFMPILVTLSGAFNLLLSPLEDVVDKLGKLSNPAEAATKAFKDQKETVHNLEKTINPLLNRYDELTNKSKLNSKEQTELKTIIQKVGAAIPLATNEVDNYGKALSINGGKAREFIAEQSKLMQYLNEDAISKEDYNLKLLEYQHENAQREANNAHLGLVKLKTNKLLPENSYFQEMRGLTQKEMEEFDTKVAAVAKRIDQVKLNLKRLKGEPLGDSTTAAITTPSVQDPPSDKDKREQEKEQEKLAKFKELLLQYRNDIAQINASKDESEVLKIKEKYDKNIADLSDLLKSKDPKVRKEAYQIVQQLQAKSAEEVLAMLNKHNRELEEKIRKHEDEITAAKLGEHEKRLNGIRESYKKELDEASDLEESKIPEIVEKGKNARLRLEKAMNLELQAETDKFNTDNAKKLAEEQAREYADTEKFKQDMLKLNQDYDDLLNGIKKPIVENKVGSKDQLEAEKADIQTKAELEILDLQAKVKRELEILGDSAEKKLALEKALAEKTKQIRDKANADALRLESEFVNKNIANYQRLANAIGDAFTALGEIIGNETEEAAALQRVAALAKIAVDTAQAISGVVAAAASTSLTPIDMAIRITAGVATVLTNIGVAKKLLSEAPKVVKQKADGGFVDVVGAQDGKQYHARFGGHAITGPVNDPTVFLAGEQPEYVIAYPEMQNPIVADLVGVAESIRQRRVRGYADGGLVQEGKEKPMRAVATVSPSVLNNNSADNERFFSIMERFLTIIENGLYAKVTTEDAFELRKLMNKAVKFAGYEP